MKYFPWNPDFLQSQVPIKGPVKNYKYHGLWIQLEQPESKKEPFNPDYSQQLVIIMLLVLVAIRFIL